ncbi:MAG: hypothetical protein PWP08_245 [Methanofollis sp.]|nr:hypothetical protein [Methanofollis sp.]
MESPKLKLRNQNIARLRQARGTFGDGVLLIDQEGAVIYVNEVFGECCGLSSDALIGRDALEVIESYIAPWLQDPDAFIETIRAIYREERDASGLEWEVGGGKNRRIVYSSENIGHGPLKDVRIDLFKNLSRTKETISASRMSGQRNEARGLPVCRTAPDLAIVSADEPFRGLFGTRTGTRAITDIISPSVAEHLRKNLATLTPSSPEIRIPEKRGEWRVHGLFDDESVLSELEWSWQARSGGNVCPAATENSARREIGCLRTLLHLLQDDEASEQALLSDAAAMICRNVPWIRGVEIRTEGGVAVSAGTGEGEQVAFPLENGNRYGEVIFHVAGEPGDPDAQADFLNAIAVCASGYFRRKTANAETESLEQSYLTLFETTGTVSFVLDPAIRVIMANREFQRFFNLKHEDLQAGIEWTTLTSEEDRSRIRRYHELRRTAPGSAPSNYECRVIAGDGTPRDVIVSVSLIPGIGRSVISLLDITAKKEAEFELRESELRYRLMTENATDIIFAMDSDLTFTYVSPSFELLTGRPGAGVIAHPITEFISPESSSLFSDAVQGVFAPRSPDEAAASLALEVETIRADGERIWMEVRINPLREGDGTRVGLMGVMRDISERKSAEEREIRYVRELSFLSSAAMGFVELPFEEEIYRFISDHLCDILEETLVFVADYDELDDTLSLRAISGLDEDENPRLYSLSRSITGIKITLPKDVMTGLRGGMLIPLEEETASRILAGPAWSLARAFAGGGQARYAAIGIVRGASLFGCVILVQKNDVPTDNVSTIETFVSLSSIALQRRQLETELESARAHLQHILSSSPVVIYSSEMPRDGESGMGPITFTTDNITALLGYEPQEVIYDASFWATRIHPSDRQRILEEELSALPDLGRLTLEYRIQHKDGKYRWLHTEVKLLRDEDRNPVEVIGSAIDISERKRIEEALRVMDSAITSSINAIIITDLDGDLVFANHSALRLWKYDDIKKVIGKPLDRFWQPRKTVVRVLERIEQDGSWIGELIGKKRGGRKFHASVAASMVTDEENDPLCIMFSFVDITEKVEIEEELARYRGHLEELVIERTEKLTRANEMLSAEVAERRRAEEAIRTLSTFRESIIENATMLLAVTDMDGVVTVWNRAAEEISGFGRDEVVGSAEIWNAVEPEDERGQNQVTGLLVELRKKEHIENFEAHIRAKNGEVRTLQWDACVLEDVGVVHIAQDVTIRRRMEKRVRESEARYRAVVEDQTEWICRFGPDLRLIFRNAAFCRSLGPGQISRPAISFREIIPEGFDDLLASLENGSLQGRQNVRIEGRVARDDRKERWHQWDIRAIPAADGSIAEYQAIGRDITEMRIAEEEFVRTEKLLSLSELAGGIAHDFNNALTSIMGNLNLAKMKVAPDDFIYRRLSEAEAATARAGALTKQLFSFSDRSAPEKETVDMADIIHEAASSSLRGSKSKCRLDLEAAPMPVHVDTTRILQVLQALIINADQAMPDGGVVTVRAACIEVRGDDPVPLPGGLYVRVTVHDHGTGILPEHMGRIFDPYFTTREHGTGLGLAMALPIIKNHGGWLDAASTPGEGTDFFLYLPASTKSIGVKTGPETAPSVGMGTILLMDDEAGILDTTTNILQYLGYTVTTAQDGEEAAMRFEETLKEGKPFDAVILDLTVPGKMGGLATLERLKEMDPQVKVVVSSGYLNDPIIRHPERYGFAASICKPYMVHELGRVLREVLSD